MVAPDTRFNSEPPDSCSRLGRQVSFRRGGPACRWITPHGPRRLVDASGTHELCESDAAIQAMSDAAQAEAC